MTEFTIVGSYAEDYKQEFTTNTINTMDYNNTIHSNTSGNTLNKEDFPQYQAGEAIHAYALPGIIVFGLIGNLCSLMVTLQKKNRKISCCIYMTTMAIADILMLNIGLMHWISKTLVKKSDLNPSATNCRIFSMLYQSIASYGVYVIVLMTLDRCLAVKLPYRSRSWRTPRAAKLTAFVLAIVVFVVNLPYFFLAGYTKERLCSALNTHSVWAKLYAWIYLILLTLLPGIAILAMNTLIIKTLKKRKTFIMRNRQNGVTASSESVLASKHSSDSHDTPDPADRDAQGKQPKNSVSKARERQLTFILLLVSFLLLLLTQPQYIRRIVYLIVDDPEGNPPETEATFHLVHSITSKMFYTNNAINFYVYILASNKFRKDFFNVFKCGKQKLYINAA